MIIINLKGGLGNQLFQYSCARSIAIRNKDILKLDTTGYSQHNGIDTIRHYALSPFNIKEEFATPEEIKKLKYPYGIISKGIRLFKSKILRQFNIGYNNKILKKRKSFYLDGFFNTEKYFYDNRNVILDDLKLRSGLGVTAKKILDNISKSANSVSLHIRRGDYVNDRITNRFHGTCSIDYYKKAIDFLINKIGNDITIFIFSDDIAWAKENVIFPYPLIFVSSPEIPDYEELILMSKCKHNIIANSSFSWWGAWLNENDGKIVIAPKRWTVRDDKNYRDIIPDSWYRI